MTARPTVPSIEFFFDPMCPWAFQTSIWIREVQQQTELDISWRFFSLESINRIEGKKQPWERAWSYGWSQMRVAAYLRRQGQHTVDRWYAAVGTAFHLEGRRTHDPDVHRQVLIEAGLPGDAVDAAITDPTTADEVRADHERAVGELGAYGVPLLVLPGDRPVFGPVVVPAPTGAEALKLWDLTLAWLDFPHLYEMARPKTAADDNHILDHFAPYLAARSWRTIQNPAPADILERA